MADDIGCCVGVGGIFQCNITVEIKSGIRAIFANNNFIQ